MAEQPRDLVGQRKPAAALMEVRPRSAHVPLRNADTGIADFDAQPASRAAIHQDPAALGVAHGVPYQGAEHPAKQIAVAAHRRRYRHDGEMDALRGRNRGAPLPVRAGD